MACLSRSAVRPLPEIPTALFTGRLNEWKGWEVFVRAAAIAHGQVPDARFRLVGGLVSGGSISDQAVVTEMDVADPTRAWLTWEGKVADARSSMRDSWVVAVPSTRPDPSRTSSSRRCRRAAP